MMRKGGDVVGAHSGPTTAPPPLLPGAHLPIKRVGGVAGVGVVQRPPKGSVPRDAARSPARQQQPQQRVRANTGYI